MSEQQLTREQALELIGKEVDGKKVLGVDCKPHGLQKHGVYLVLRSPGKICEFLKVGDGQETK